MAYLRVQMNVVSVLLLSRRRLRDHARAYVNEISHSANR